MKITLDLPEHILCAFINGVRYTPTGLEMVSYSLDSEDLVDGKLVNLPRKDIKNDKQRIHRKDSRSSCS